MSSHRKIIPYAKMMSQHDVDGVTTLRISTLLVGLKENVEK